MHFNFLNCLWGITLLRFLGVVLFTGLLFGCHSPRTNQNYGQVTNIDRTVGLKQRENVTDKKVVQLENELASKGVDIISVGQDYRIIIPANLIYYHASPKLIWGSYDTINLVVDYIKQFRTVSMRVDAYSQGADNEFSGALSLARTRTMVDYLWSQAIDTRFLYTQAHIMERSPNAWYKDKQGKSDVPTRVEITFRNTIV